MHNIIKSSGKQEPFNVEKFERSLKRVGAPAALIKEITQEVLDRPKLDTTYKIYQYAYQKLKEWTRPLAARYSLKNALYELGPEGFIFERFAAELFKAQGYSVEVGKIVTGRCVDHEIDVILKKNKDLSMAECKFHNRRGLKTDVKVALYVKARYLDLSQEYPHGNTLLRTFKDVWLVTNTQFTSQAIQYSLCSGIRLLGWAFPEEKNIAYFIDTFGLHPVTSLTLLSRSQKKFLLAKDVLLCRDLLEQPVVLQEFGFSQLQQQSVLDEASHLCAQSNPL